VIALGWKYPLLGFVVPVVMMTGFIVGTFHGRWVCGNLCPRGKFFQKILSRFSPNKKFPTALRTKTFRFAFFALLIGFMIFRLSQDPNNLEHWGSVFWLMCTITTAIGIVLAFIFTPRSWCMICPIGTAGAHISGKKFSPQIDHDECLGCKICEKVCPMQLEITSDKKQIDCLQCHKCELACPKKCLTIKK